MAEPFKNFINPSVIKTMANCFKKNWSTFDTQGFISDASRNLEQLELKARTDRLTDTMSHYLPQAFAHSCEIMLASLAPPLDEKISATTANSNSISGWPVIALTNYVAKHGQAHFDLSMESLKEMTKRSTSEFAIREFILQQPNKTLETLHSWTKDHDHHVRRLASEGCRPRLPWGNHLKCFIDNPEPVIDILEKLKDDKQEYVRRSVANNLNDIAKDHPQRIIKLARTWLQDASNERQKLIRHACRTLIKAGDQQIFSVFGYQAPKLKARLEILTPTINLGDVLQFNLQIDSQAKQTQALIIDFIIHFRKANGSSSKKVFKWREVKLAANSKIELSKGQSIRKITTRKYYSGENLLEIMINGQCLTKQTFDLMVTNDND
ncbi:MAG: DNA alkylation repair protein [Gammaproteobacteria bacterium]|nr:DNA alkylation repair protein [Gammaproteobacteria bacterium]